MKEREIPERTVPPFDDEPAIDVMEEMIFGYVTNDEEKEDEKKKKGK